MLQIQTSVSLRPQTPALVFFVTPSVANSTFQSVPPPLQAIGYMTLCSEDYNKKAQLSLTNPRDACEKFARFT